MHILYLHQYYCPAGGWGNDRSQQLAARWVARGARVQLITSTALFPPKHPAHSLPVFRFQENGVEVIALRVPYAQQMSYPRRIWAFLQFYRALLRNARNLDRPDIVYASSTPPSVVWAGRKLARRWQRPYVFEVVDVWPQVPIGMGIVRNVYVQAFLHGWVDDLYRDAARVVALSEGMAAEIRQRGVPEAKIRVSHNGTDCSRFQPGEQGPLANSPLRLVYAGAVGRANHLPFLLRALLLLRQMQDVPAFRLEVVGGGAEWGRVTALVREWNLTDCVTLTPAIPKTQMPALLARADVGIVTFAPHRVLETNSANKFYDYLAAGLPVVLNYEGWQADYLSRYGCGLSSREVEQFTLHLYRLLCNPMLRVEMGRNARQLAEAHFDRQQIADVLYEDLLELSSARGAQ